MSFLETPQFPLRASYGATGGPEFQTDVVQLNSGWEQRNVQWDQARAKYTIELPLSAADMATLVNWFRAVRGRAHGFRMRDWTDYTCDATAGRLGTSALGTGLATYQLYKRYTAGTLTSDRKIGKPKYLTAISLYRASVLQTAGSGAGNYALDTTTGIVTFVADSSQAVSTVSIAANAVVTLAVALSGLTTGGKLYLTSLGGSVGTVLNGLAHDVIGVAGAAYTISTSTVGKAYTSSGTGRKYPQPTEALTWAGQFDVPVRFDADYLSVQAEAPSFYRGPMTLVETRT